MARCLGKSGRAERREWDGESLAQAFLLAMPDAGGRARVGVVLDERGRGEYRGGLSVFGARLRSGGTQGCRWTRDHL